MNIFVLDNDPELCASYHCDRHVVKMILEHTQMISTVYDKYTGMSFYKPCYKKHPCTIWVGECIENFQWLCQLTYCLNREWKIRYPKVSDLDHVSANKLQRFNNANYHVLQKSMPSFGKMTPFAQAMPDDCKDPDAVIAYRKYYVNHKTHLHSWKVRNAPEWLTYSTYKLNTTGA